MSNREAPEITYAASPKWRLSFASAATAQRIFRCLVCLFLFLDVWSVVSNLSLSGLSSFPVWPVLSISLCCFMFRPAAFCCTLLHARLLHCISCETVARYCMQDCCTVLHARRLHCIACKTVALYCIECFCWVCCTLLLCT